MRDAPRGEDRNVRCVFGERVRRGAEEGGHNVGTTYLAMIVNTLVFARTMTSV